MTLEEFMQQYCDYCGSQRCDPRDPEWREGCLYFQKEKPRLQLMGDGVCSFNKSVNS